jgi:N-acyl-D-amino-acid deacylase
LECAPQTVEPASVDGPAAQQSDGWAQRDSLESDACATAQTLCALFMLGAIAAKAAYRRGIELVLTAQRKDGSWFVKSRSKPIQVYFNDGGPRGADQFISSCVLGTDGNGQNAREGT